ncbi:MAG: hypothetical protein IPJ65_03360 [Archangiaceae bacterium]|nr:hypothetical protein [Archangiaceae bacterium]
MWNAVFVLCLTAAPGNTVEQADEAFHAGRYQEVLPLLEQALADPALAPADQVRAHALAALMHVAFDRPTEAIAAYQKALALDPGYQPPPDVSPRVRALFDEAKKNQLRKREPPPDWAQAPAPAPESAPLLKSPWLWGGVGVAAVVAGVVTAVLVVRAQVPHGNLPTGRLE